VTPSTVAAVSWTLVAPIWRWPWDSFGGTIPFGDLDAEVRLGGLLVAIVVAGTVAPYALMVMAVGRIGPTAAGVTGMIEPMVAAVVGWMLLGQSLAAIQVAGIAIALGALVTAEIARSRMPHVVSPVSEGLPP